MDDDKHKTEILIIRRSNGESDGGHHGGAWKIAYADFVTAMMAFFLVMWLINSANEATRARVASYFNPIKMTDAAPGGRGLKDMNNTKKSESKVKAETAGDKSGDTQDEKSSAKTGDVAASSPKPADDPLHDPYKLLEQISQEGQAHPSGRTVDVVSAQAGDPFDPRAWEALRAGKQAMDVASADKLGDAPPEAGTAAHSDTQPQIKPPDATKPAAAEKPAPPVVDQALKEIAAAITAAGAENDVKASVKMTAEGLLIVLSDQSSQPMFSVGSARPTPALIDIIGTIGKILEAQQGKVVIRGHTDARQFKSATFDNWQLSTARAHMASYILMRAGLDESRILKIEGFGAAAPLDSANPLADENRRVEFLLQKR